MIIGIDLGTTNSAAAIWRDGKAELIPNSLDHVLTPSAVGIDDTGEWLVGLAARERQSTHPHLTASAFKRYMGTTRMTTLGKDQYSAEQLSAMVLKSLKADVEVYLGPPVPDAVITVPAYFNDKQRKATHRAAQLAGLTVERLLNEPTAAALAYGIHNLADEARFLVFDLGGGTFDVSIVEIFEGIIEVRASTGDNRLGGEDFNDLLIKAMRWKLQTTLKATADEEDALHQLLRAAAERARRALTTQAETTMDLAWKGEAHSFAISASDLETLAEPLIERLKAPIVRAVRDAGLRPESLSEIILVGGATRMPIVRRAVTRIFDRFPSHAVNPDEAVALGAAVQAGLKMRDNALSEVVVTDVCPFSLGIEVADIDSSGRVRGGIFAPVIERNITVPASRQKTFTTTATNQKFITLRVFQGESRHVQENIELGQISVPVPPKPAGEVGVDVRFTYDINGLIDIDVDIPLTGHHQQLTIVDEHGPKGEDLERQRQALAALKVHPRDNAANRFTLARAERCYEDSLGDRRREVGNVIRQFEDILERQDPRQIEQARDDVMRFLDSIEGETFL